MRWAGYTAVALALLGACSSGEAEPRGESIHRGSPSTFLVGRAGDGLCEFDYRAQVSAVDLADGAERWVIDVPFPGETDLQVAEGLLVARSADYPGDPPSVFALSASDGRPAWQREVTASPGAASEPGVGDNLVVTRDGDSIVGLSTSDGTELWRHLSGSEPVVMIDGPDVVVGRSDRGEVELLEATTGQVQWTAPLAGGRSGITGVAFTATTVVTGGQEGELVGLDRSTGEIQWNVPSVRGRFRSQVLGPEQGVVVIIDVAASDGAGQLEDSETYLIGIDGESGAIRWRVPIGELGHESTALLGDLVLVPVGDSLQALEVSTGEIRWTHPSNDAGQVSRPTDDLVVVATSDYASATTTLSAIDAVSGDEAWTASLPVAATGPVTATEDLLLVGGGVGQDSALVDAKQDGLVFAISIDDGTELWRAVRRDSATSPILVHDDTAIVLSADRPIFCD